MSQQPQSSNMMSQQPNGRFARIKKGAKNVGNKILNGVAFVGSTAVDALTSMPIIM